MSWIVEISALGTFLKNDTFRIRVEKGDPQELQDLLNLSTKLKVKAVPVNPSMLTSEHVEEA